MKQPCQCHCGTTTFEVHGKPIIRALCHCNICQAFNNKPYADITVFFAADVNLPEDNLIEFRTYRAPPAVQRGKCTACKKPAIEFLKIPLLPKLAIIPSANFCNEHCLPKPSLHIFYHRRIADISDELPKYSGYWQSQMALVRRLILPLIGGRKGGRKTE